MDNFEKIFNDKEIIDRYLEIEKYEEIMKFYAHHNLEHVKDVICIVEKLLIGLNYDKSFIEDAKIAALLHDTGVNEGKEGHAYRSYLFAKDYFIRKNITLDNKDLILEAIKIHSDGFDTNNVIALSIILADKLDIKHTRITEYGKNIVGNRQFQYIKNVLVEINDKVLEINFIMDDDIDIVELEQYYFTEKIFNSIISFCSKMKLIPKVLINGKNWEKFISYKLS